MSNITLGSESFWEAVKPKTLFSTRLSEAVRALGLSWSDLEVAHEPKIV
jgi:hypothetical protein